MIILSASAQHVRIHILGEVVHPGTYAVYPRAPMTDIIRIAGGTTSYGSVRHISVIRDGALLFSHDIYTEHEDSPQRRHPDLHDADIVLIGITDCRVCISGLVKHPGRYDLQEGESLSDLLRHAGGMTDTPEGVVIQLHRSEHGLMTLTDIFHSERDATLLHDGDSICVMPIIRGREGKVCISGAVSRPGTYEWNSGSTLSSLVQEAGGLAKDALLCHIIIHRHGSRYEHTLLSADLSTAEGGDLLLCAEDSVFVPQADPASMKRTVKISGGVFHPGVYPYAAEMSVSDLLVLSGGLRPEAVGTRMMLYRRNAAQEVAHGDTLATAFILPSSDVLPSTRLLPYDEVVVLSAAKEKMRGDVCLLGAVNFTGTYAWHPSLTVQQVIENAGGLAYGAYYMPAVVRRGRLVHVPPTANDFLLQEGDTLIVPYQPTVVNVAGEVQQRSVKVPYRNGARLKHYLSQAGGVNAAASTRHIYGVTINNKAFKIRRNSLIPPGTTIVVPPKAHANSPEVLSPETLHALLMQTLLLSSRYIHL